MSLHQPVHRPPTRRDGPAHLSAAPAPARATQFERPEPFEIEVRPARQRVIVAVRGELDLATVDRLAEAIDNLTEAGFDQIVVDLRAVSFMDSTGLCLIIRQVRRPDATVRLIDGGPAVARLFDLTGVRAELDFLAPHEVLLTR
jgi:anti-sigma B factor antagonist